MTYQKAQLKYMFCAGDTERFKHLTRMGDFDLLDCEVEDVPAKPTAAEVERILDRYNDLVCGDDEIYYWKSGLMRRAIRSVMGRGYLDS